jgi:hypothetical protein
MVYASVIWILFLIIATTGFLAGMASARFIISQVQNLSVILLLAAVSIFLLAISKKSEPILQSILKQKISLVRRSSLVAFLVLFSTGFAVSWLALAIGGIWGIVASFLYNFLQ